MADYQEIPTFCELCFWKCGIIARTRNNRVLELHGHPDYPNSRGRLCGRGNGGAGFLKDGDRLKYPMKRVGKRGEGRFERIGWKTAYRLIAARFKAIKKQYGAKALALFYHGSGGPFMRTMMAAFGSPNFAAPAYAQCKGARNMGYKLTFGEKFPGHEPLDFKHTQCMVLFGSHLGENAHNSQVQDFVDARRRGAKLIVLDPRLSTVAARSDVWLPVRPGSDLAIILGWIHLLLEEDNYNHEFVENHCTGLDKLIAHVADKTPQWAAEQSGVPVKDILASYALIRAAGPATIIHPGRHVSWYGEEDTQRARGQAILTALLGAWWHKGGTFIPHKINLPDFPGPDFPDLPPNVDRAGNRFPFAPEPTTTGIRASTLNEEPYPIKGWMVFGANLIQSLPDVRETVKAINKLDTLVVIDIIPTEITRYADILLPEDIYLERYDDLFLGKDRQPYIALRQPVVKTAYDTKPAWQISKELGTELGVGDFFNFETFEQYLDKRLQGSGITLEELKKQGIFFPDPDRIRDLYLDPSEPFHFHTPSGKIELFSQQMADAGFDPLPDYTPQPKPPPHHFRMLYGRNPLHTFGRTQNNPLLSDLAPENDLWLHPVNAKNLGLTQGELVIIKNQRGDKTGPMGLKITERISEDSIYLWHGFGHTAKGLSRACSMGGSDSEVIDTYSVDPITGSTGMRTTFVTVHSAKPEKE